MVGEALAEEAGGEAEEEAIAEDGIPARPLAAPPRPTAEMVEFYNVSHIPFRSWCPHCVPGRGRSFYHRRVDHKGDDTLLPGVSIDCGFFGAPGELPQDAVGGSKMPVLVVRDRFTKAIFTHLVPA